MLQLQGALLDKQAGILILGGGGSARNARYALESLTEPTWGRTKSASDANLRARVVLPRRLADIAANKRAAGAAPPAARAWDSVLRESARQLS